MDLEVDRSENKKEQRIDLERKEFIETKKGKTKTTPLKPEVRNGSAKERLYLQIFSIHD